MSGTRAWEMHQLVVRLRDEIEVRFLRLGMALRLIRDERLYEALGHATFESYLGDAEVGLSRRHAYRLIGVAETYLPARATAVANGAGPELESLADADRLASVGVRKLDILRPVVADAPPDEVGRWLATAEALSVSDLELEVREARGLPADARHQYLLRLARQISGMAASLPHVGSPGAVLDEIVAACLDAQARLEEEGWAG